MRRTAPLAVALLTAVLAGSAYGQGSPPAPAAPPLDQTEPPDLAKPYKQVAITAPATVTDPALAAFRKKAGEAAKRKDRAALARLVVRKGFFWDREGGDAADKRKPGLDNLAAAIGLDSKDAPGWDMLLGYSEDPTASTPSDHPGATCSPGDPGFDAKAMQALLQATGSDLAEWGYPVRSGIDVRDKPDPKAPVTQKLGLSFVRVAPDAASEPLAGSFLRIVTPAGKFGYVTIDDIAPLGNDQICYAKEDGEWKIAGYIGIGSDIP